MSKFVILHKKTTDFAQNSSCHRTTIAHFLNSGKWDDTLLESTLKSSVVEILNIFCKHFQKHLNLTDTIVFLIILFLLTHNQAKIERDTAIIISTIP